MRMSHVLRSLVMALVLVSLAAAAPPPVQRGAPVTFGVPGHTNAAPWVASAGRFVAVTWGAQAGKGWDVYVAVSNDEGATFGAPVRVNAVAGDGRISGEIPPRVALHVPAGARVPEVVVAWNAKDHGTEIKIARSRDGGRTFAAPASLQAAGAAGDRGWHALTVDAQGLAHVVWLDHRGLADASAQSGATAGAGHGGASTAEKHDGAAMAQKSRLHYATLGATAATEQRVASGVCYCCKTRSRRRAGASLLCGGTSTPATSATSRSRGRAYRRRLRRRPGSVRMAGRSTVAQTMARRRPWAPTIACTRCGRR